MVPPDPMTELESLIFDFAPVGLVLADDRIIKACNAQFATLFGYAREELIGQNFSILYPSYQEFITIGNRVMEHPDIANYWDERIMARKDQSLFWCRVRSRSFVAENPLRRAVYSFEDLSATREVIELTRRERDVVSLLAEGKSSKEIAMKLCLSHRTVEIYRSKLLTKFNVNSTPALLRCLGII